MLLSKDVEQFLNSALPNAHIFSEFVTVLVPERPDSTKDPAGSGRAI